MRLTVERVANVLIIATALVGLPLGSLRLYDMYTTRVAPAAAPALYAEGESFAEGIPIEFGSARQALVVYVSSTCQYCTGSMDFYRRLAAARVASGGKLRLIAMGPEQADVLSSYMASHNVETDQRLQVSRGQAKLTGTPALLLLSRDRKIVGIWMGQLSPEEEQRVFDRLRG